MKNEILNVQQLSQYSSFDFFGFQGMKDINGDVARILRSKNRFPIIHIAL